MLKLKLLIAIVTFSLKSQLNYLKKLFSPKGRKELIIDDANEKLENYLRRQVLSQKLLKIEINHYFNKKSGAFHSKYIKPKRKSNHEIYLECVRVFGERMKQCDLKITENLEFK